MKDPTNALRKARLRKVRSDAGLKELRLWLPPASLADLREVQKLSGYSAREAAAYCFSFMATRERLFADAEDTKE
jgi:hypothetical protein